MGLAAKKEDPYDKNGLSNTEKFTVFPNLTVS